MRIPFTKPDSAQSSTEFPIPSSDRLGPHPAGDSSLDPANTPANFPAMDSQLSPQARHSALHLVGTIREILVGDQVRSLDGRFVQLRDILQSHFSALVGKLNGEVKSFQAETKSGMERLNATVEAKTEELRRQDAKTGEDIKIASLRINSIEEDVTASVTRLRSEDARITTELDNALGRLDALETRLVEKSERFDRMQEKAEEEIQQTAARLDAVEKNLAAFAENLHAQDAALKDSIHVAIMRIGSLEENLVKHIDEMRRQDAELRDDIVAGDNRIVRVEEANEKLRCAVNDKMRELCDYVSGQVADFSRQMAGRIATAEPGILPSPQGPMKFGPQFVPAAPAPAPAASVFLPAAASLLAAPAFPDISLRKNGSNNGSH